jgi:hypothetical protein
LTLSKSNILKIGMVIIGLNIFIQPLYGQVKQSHSIVISFLQIKDEFNIGMVFMRGHGGQYVFINRAKSLMVPDKDRKSTRLNSSH